VSGSPELGAWLRQQREDRAVAVERLLSCRPSNSPAIPSEPPGLKVAGERCPAWLGTAGI